MSLQKLIYTKNWEDPRDFPTIETSEAQVRADIQDLYDQVKVAFNGLIDKLTSTTPGDSGADQIGMAPVPGFEGSTITEMLEEASHKADAAKEEAENFATLAESYAKGGTGTRQGENTDNALWYKEQSELAVSLAEMQVTEARTYANRSSNSATAAAQSAAAAAASAEEAREYVAPADEKITNVATEVATEVVDEALADKADTNSPTFTGTPKAPTAPAGTNNTQIATTEFVQTAVSGKANTASPAFTGTPTAPTAAAGTNTTQIATTEFVQTAVSGKQAQHEKATPMLAIASWRNNQQTVSVTGVTASNTVQVSPAPASLEAYAEAGVYCSAQAAGTLTFKCKTVPSVALTVNVVIWDEGGQL